MYLDYDSYNLIWEFYAVTLNFARILDGHGTYHLVCVIELSTTGSLGIGSLTIVHTVKDARASTPQSLFQS